MEPTPLSAPVVQNEKPSDGDMTLEDAETLLSNLKKQKREQEDGASDDTLPVSDARLSERIRNAERFVTELQADEGNHVGKKAKMIA